MIRGFFDFVISLGSQRDDLSRARLNFLKVRHGLLVTHHRERVFRIASGDNHYRQILVDQRVRPVLHFSRRISFRMNVGNFLQLQCAFKRNGIVNASS